VRQIGKGDFRTADRARSGALRADFFGFFGALKKGALFLVDAKKGVRGYAARGPSKTGNALRFHLSVQLASGLCAVRRNFH
jgi:hypothetical protein